MIKEKRVLKNRINSKNKGSSFERKVSNLFKKHWGVTSYRTPGSGAYTSRAVGNKLKDVVAGDVVIEDIPELIIECKNYYSLHVTNWFSNNKKEDTISNFWNKLQKEATEFKKIPLLICKEDKSPIVCIVNQYLGNIIKDYTGKFDKMFLLVYNDICLYMINFSELLEIDIETIKKIISEY